MSDRLWHLVIFALATIQLITGLAILYANRTFRAIDRWEGLIAERLVRVEVAIEELKTRRIS